MVSLRGLRTGVSFSTRPVIATLLRTRKGERGDMAARSSETTQPSNDVAIDEMTEAAADVRQLRSMIEALREALEQLEAERADAVQAAVRDANDEITQLQGAVSALRAQLETQAADHQDALAAADRAFRDERDQLTKTIAALRTQLEARDGK